METEISEEMACDAERTRVAHTSECQENGDESGVNVQFAVRLPKDSQPALIQSTGVED